MLLGLFGIVYTSIGVAHTLYAPRQKWRPRIVLLGAAFGITAAAHLSTALVGLVLAGFFMLYLAPGRRLASLVILVEASVLGFLILWACYGFSAAVFGVEVGDALRISSGLLQAPLLNASALPLLLLFAVSLLTFLLWQRSRYFGNWAPLLVFTLLAIVRFGQGESVDWALPFGFVFIGGIFADLFETRWRRYAIAAALLAVAGQALLAIARLGAG